MTFSDAASYTGYINEIRTYLVYSEDITMNQVVIDYSAMTFSFDIIAITVQRFNNMVNGIECLQSCPPMAGSSISFDVSTDPPSCVYCRESENRVPDPENGGCKCIDSYYANADDVCVLCTTGINLCIECSSGTPSVCD